MLFTKQFLQERFPAAGDTDSDDVIRHVMTDSRQPSEKALFIPIVGDQFDGHHFIADAMEKGAICAIWQKDRPIPADSPASFTFFLVDDTLTAMQQLAADYRDEVNPTVIGITGSNGKTTTKDLVQAMVKKVYKTHATKGNFNNHIGLPLTILSMKRDTEVLILEMGMNNFHEIERLSEIAKPDYAIITNIGESHIEYLGSREGIAQAKLEIKSGLQNNGQLLIDGDEKLLQQVKGSVVSCGFLPMNDLIISNVRLQNHITAFQLNGDDFQVPLLGEHHAKNASFAVVIGRELGISDQTIQDGFNQLSYTKMRFERVTGKKDVTLINDAYNASVTSMKAAIEVVKQLEGFKQKVVVLGDILELGEKSIPFHRHVGEVINAPIDILYTYGEKAKWIAETADPHVVNKHFSDKQALIEALQPLLKKETIILFKASRGMKFEELVTACM